jgi:hypothetical protein
MMFLEDHLLAVARKQAAADDVVEAEHLGIELHLQGRGEDVLAA